MKFEPDSPIPYRLADVALPPTSEQLPPIDWTRPVELDPRLYDGDSVVLGALVRAIVREGKAAP